MAGEFTEFFEQLMFGAGSWIGLILIVVMLLIIAAINRYASIVGVPIAVFVSFEYMNRDLGWHAIIVFLSALVIMLTAMYQKVKK